MYFSEIQEEFYKFSKISYNANQGEVSVMEGQKKETIIKTIRFEKELAEKIEALANQSQRDFAKQVRFMLLQYMELIERK